MDDLIDRIEVGEKTVVDGKNVRDIKIYYRFVGNIRTACSAQRLCSADNYALPFQNGSATDFNSLVSSKR